MKKILINIGIMLIAFMLFFILPLDSVALSTNKVSKNKIAFDKSFPSVAHGYTVSQQFVPQYDYIKNLKICVREINCDTSQGYIQSSILDSNQNILYQGQLPLTELTYTGWYTVLTDIELHAGETYYLNVDTINALDDGPTLSFYTELNAASTEEEGQALTYASFPVENCVFKVFFEYQIPLNKFDYFGYYLFAAFLISLFITNSISLITAYQKRSKSH